MNTGTPFTLQGYDSFWTRRALIKIALKTANLDSFEDCCRALLADHLSLRENLDLLDWVIDEMRVERGMAKQCKDSA